ncbi:MAG: glycoside hydrolase family 16 protein [Solirubrobacteraceae bacterium]
MGDAGSPMAGAGGTFARRRAATLLLALAGIAGYAAFKASTALSYEPFAASAAAAGTHKPATHKPASTTHTKLRKFHVSAPGSYAIIVSLGPLQTSETADVYVGSQSAVGASVGSGGLKYEFMDSVKRRSFSVRVVSHGAAIPFSVGSALQPSSSAPPPALTSTGATSPTGPVTGPYNNLVWSDEFTGAAGAPPNPANWAADSGGGCGPGTLSTNTPNIANAQLNGAGQLAITAFGPTASPAYSTAQLDTAGLFSFTYGRIEARVDVAAGQGICSAFWLYADDGEQVGWPNGGEIDVMEAIGNIPTQTNGFLHGPTGSTDPNSNFQQWNSDVTSVTPLAGGYHTYGLIWKPNSLTWTLDGVPFATATPAKLTTGSTWVFNGHPFHILLDEAVGGWPGNPNAATVFPASMLVDWVHVYQ